jgi:hypothetical protein
MLHRRFTPPLISTLCVALALCALPIEPLRADPPDLQAAASPMRKSPTVGNLKTAASTSSSSASGSSGEPTFNNPNVPHPPLRFPPKEAAFVIVHASFAHTEVTVDGLPYPQRSHVGAVVHGGHGRVHEVVVKDTKTNAAKTYAVRLRAGEAHVLVVDFSEGSMPSAPPKTPGGQPPKTPDKGAPEAANGEAEMGYITVNSKPESRVYIDGKMVSQTTPLNRYKLPVGSHTVRVFYTGANEFSETRRASITADRHISLHFQQPQKQP